MQNIAPDFPPFAADSTSMNTRSFLVGDDTIRKCAPDVESEN